MNQKKKKIIAKSSFCEFTSREIVFKADSAMMLIFYIQIKIITF